MLTRLIVDVYAWIIEIYLWLVLLILGVVGYNYSVPMLKGAGLILEPQAGGKIVGALIFALAAFLVSAVATGPILVLVDIRKSIRAFETKRSGSDNEFLLPERREPR